MSDIGSALKELAAIQRSRKLVEAALIAPDVKAAMLAELERQEKAVSFKTDGGSQSAKNLAQWAA